MKIKKLTKKDWDNMWGENGPYSQVNLKEQTRILDDSISRVFLVVEAEINPFTFEYCLKHREKFLGDPAIQQLLDHAEYRGVEGYVVGAGEEELRDKRSFEIAFSYRKTMLESVLKMHRFVMEELGIVRQMGRGVEIEDAVSDKEIKLVWSESLGKAVPINDNVWDSKTVVHSPAGTQNGKIRYYVVLALAKGVALVREDIKYSALRIHEIADRLDVDIEEGEGGMGYMMFTVLIGHDRAPADFTEKSIDASNEKKVLFAKDNLITNVSRPTSMEIESFLRSIKRRNN
ncbi:MAG: hypothetical protein COV91_01615 [Candidatus Taylorbacteria bacterium CG11_big_fil_rev_8_21_14_0_20_46_11]|uniref:Uncharacterized protein n=1 Tax=Candidatus Taylorbacteria bacterium CG11_big_fil_rev_8_21_14_0_20_46_11 TaxID=1975025 RepID=A0A2H0KCA1_9BACT|nr:MAG: hypothetical protein COV91_01615 [Candidatus Taylorbacteria bacterium CG11_big_fil_rev_8_21_14_0_20_46_11]